MSPSSFDLRSHRPAIVPEQIDELRRRLFGGPRSRPTIPGYELEGELGRGAFGRVYKAFDPRFQRTVALKVIAVDSPNARTRIEREAHALARLSHPNVVQVYDKGPAGPDGYFLALEHVDGPDLARWLALRPRVLREILAKFLDVAEGLAAAHHAGLVHRDLKPTNAIVGSDGRVRLLDFGLARATDDSITTSTDEPLGRHLVQTATVDGPELAWSCAEPSPAATDRATVLHVVPGQPELGPGEQQQGCARPGGELARPVTARGRFVGTPSYAAPEQHHGFADARSDQFSFCVALFEAVYGRRPLPWRQGVDPGVQLHTERIEFPRRRGVPRWLVALLRRGLALDPSQRHPDMHAIARTLRHRLSTRPARVRGAWLALGAATLTAGTMILLGQRPNDDALEACRRGREAGPAAWVEHRSTVTGHAPALGAELDAWAERWVAARQSVCHEPQPPRRAELDACLDAGANSLGRLVGWLGTADRATWQALQAHPGPRPLAGVIETLPDPTRCASGTEPRATTQARVAWGHLLAARMGLTERGSDVAEREAALAVEQAQVLGDPGLRVAAEHHRLLLDARRGEPHDLVEVLSLLVRALEAGERSLAADIAASSMTLRATGRLGTAPGWSAALSPETIDRLAEELAALRVAEAGASDDPSEPAVSGWLRLAEGHARLLMGDPAGAQALYREAGDLLRRASPGVPPHLVALTELAEATAMASQDPPVPAAAPLAARALEQRRHALGTMHPLVAHETRLLGEISVRLLDFEAALRRYQEAELRFDLLGLPLERAFVRAEIVHVHWVAARQARRRAQAAERDEEPSKPHWEEFERRRHLALRETLALEQLATPLLTEQSASHQRPRDQARLWAVAMASYGYHKGCYEPLLQAARRLEAVCEQLDGGEPSCVAGQRQRQRMLERGGADRATHEPCIPTPDAY